jgi:hypothetical protein
MATPANWAQQFAMLQKASRLPSWRSTFPASLLASNNESSGAAWQWSRMACGAIPTANVFGVDHMPVVRCERNQLPASRRR